MANEGNDGNGGTVRFTIKELIAQQSEEIRATRIAVENLSAKLENKADRDRVHHLESSMAAANLTISKLNDVGSVPVQDLVNRVRDLEKITTQRGELVEQFRTVQSQVSMLVGWRNTLIGAISLVSALSGAALAFALKLF